MKKWRNLFKFLTILLVTIIVLCVSYEIYLKINDNRYTKVETPYIVEHKILMASK